MSRPDNVSGRLSVFGRIWGGAVLLVLMSAVAHASTTTIASSANPGFVGQSITFTAVVAVNGAEPTGTVRFADGVTAISTCDAVALTGAGNTRTATCTTGALTLGAHSISALYAVDPVNGVSAGSLVQVTAPSVPGTATIVSNPYGTLTVTGATLFGNTISSMSNNVVIQLGKVPGSTGAAAVFDFQGLNIGPDSEVWIRSGAAGQVVRLVDSSASASAIGGYLTANDFGGGGFPVLYLKNSNGVAIHAGAAVNGQAGVIIDTLGATWTEGRALVNNGVIDAGPSLEILASNVTGSGEHRGDNIMIHTFGNAHNPIDGNYYLHNGLLLQATSNVDVALTLNAYGSTPQVFNFRVVRNNGVTLRMPSAWPSGWAIPANNAVVAPGDVRPAGMPDPGYGGGSMIVQAEGRITLGATATGDFAFPGAVVLKSDVAIDTNGVLVNQGWTASGRAFQGVFFEAPSIGSSSFIRVYGNDLNWVNFSTFPATPVRALALVRNVDGSASYASSDATAPHLNTYSTLINTAAAGGCWTCLLETAPVNMTGP
ncbi:MAG: Ig-like domain-containing protein [Betaproteobacteria bacterium]